MTASIFCRLRTMPGSPSSRAMSASPNAGDAVDLEAGEGGAERLALLQDSQPRQAGLIDLQREPLEQHRLVLGGKPVFAGRGRARAAGGRGRRGNRRRSSRDDRRWRGPAPARSHESRKLNQGEHDEVNAEPDHRRDRGGQGELAQQ